MNILNDFRILQAHVKLVIAAEFCLQLINASFMSILPLYMQAEGFKDYEYADFTSYRYLGVLVLSLIVGIYIKGRKIKPLFLASSVLVPSFGLLILYAVETHNRELLYTAQISWGVAFTLMQVPVLPYILRNSPKENHTAGIALSYSTWSFAGMIGGWIISSFNYVDPILFSERTLLILITLLGFVSVILVLLMRHKEVTRDESVKKIKFREHDWGLITKALIPTLIIAVGAGLTIPFISLFFSNVHHLSTAEIAFVNSAASVLIAGAALLVPLIKRTLGYKIAVPGTQSFAVIALVLLATTQYYAHLEIAASIAVICFLFRQPLMNLAGPMTSEIVMGYAGKRNREIVSALSAAIWSGSWYLSGRVFYHLSEAGYAYVNIFLITAGMYAVGVLWYYFLILDYHSRQTKGLAE